MRIAKLLLTFLGTLLLAIPIYPAEAQETKQTVQAKLAESEATDRAEEQMTEYELAWKALETHGKVELKIGGKGVNMKKMFKQGEEPFFNAFEEGLKPGIYSYTITFTPNQMVDDQNSLQDEKVDIRELWKLRKEKLEEGDREGANALYKEIRKRTNAIQNENQKIQKSDDYDFISKKGQLIVDKNGTIKKFDFEKFMKEQEKKALAENKEKQRKAKGGGDGRIDY